MTNKDKFLRDGVSVEEYCKAIDNYIKGNGYSGRISKEFLNAPVQPILTKDEKVILRNIDKIFEYIGRTKNGTLFLRIEMFSKIDDRAFHFYNHLFQFIKEGEEYSIKELLGDNE